MTHRDRPGDASGHRAGQRAGRREAAGDAGPRQGFPTPAHSPAAGSPARPERRLPKGFRPGGGRRMAFRRATWLAMPCIAAPRACSPKALGNRLYGSLSTPLGIRCRSAYLNRRSSNSDRRVVPTAPVAPTIATLGPPFDHMGRASLQFNSGGRRVTARYRAAAAARRLGHIGQFRLTAKPLNRISTTPNDWTIDRTRS